MQASIEEQAQEIKVQRWATLRKPLNLYCQFSPFAPPPEHLRELASRLIFFEQYHLKAKEKSNENH